eukprot:CAMPEP_0185907622 /NCGR_PEP_ID=MMETSP0196C-20130402/7416_1 /TAXON_ID=2932 /ORGANISM="Alexandrium fundyense, Strain CCMP1719" /LENGTH=30 /DNA_ID= /DNA_START= /DNA_END= /DNA_ORIENTATION=
MAKISELGWCSVKNTGTPADANSFKDSTNV